MATVDIVYEKIHHRHDPRWCACTGPGHDVGAGAMASFRVCVACVIELMDSQDVSVIILHFINLIGYHCWNTGVVFKLLVILYR